MSKTVLRAAFSSIAVAAIVLPASAADVTQQRLMNAAGEPQNWLMVVAGGAANFRGAVLYQPSAIVAVFRL
jgi:hypothetical protein